MTHAHKQTGVSIVEIMVGIAISLILLAGVMQIFITNKQSYRVQQAFSRLQENGRYAMHFLTQDLRMAGYFGCASAIDSPNNIVDIDGIAGPDPISDFSGNGLQGYEYGDLPLVLNDTTNLTTTEVYPNTDFITIKRGTNTGIHPTGPINSLNGQLKLPEDIASGLFAVKDILFVTDCEAADTFAATTVNDVTGAGGKKWIEISHADNFNTDPQLSKIYDTDAEVMKLVFHTYYVGTNSAGVPALFRVAMGNAGSIGTPQELVEGVEDMQLLYGEDTDGDGVVNKYVGAGAVTDFTDVISIRATLTIRTIEDNIAATTTVEGDKRLRRHFTSLITIRNRVS